MFGLTSAESDPKILRCADLGAVNRALIRRVCSRFVTECFCMTLLMLVRTVRKSMSQSLSHWYHAGIGSVHVAGGEGVNGLE